MPVAYLVMLRLEFNNGRIWEIDVQEKLEHEDPRDIADKLLDTFQEYRNDIKKIDFKIDIDKLKKDITDSSKNLL